MESSKRIRLGVLINCLEVGGAQKMALAIANGLKNYVDEIVFFQINKDIESIYFNQLTAFKDDNHKILSSLSVNDLTIKKIVNSPLIIKKLNNILREKNINVVLSFMEQSNILNLCLPKKYYKIISIRNHPNFIKGKTFIKKFCIDLGYKLLLNKADIVNFNSYESAYAFQKLYAIKNYQLSVIYNMIDSKLVAKLANKNIPSEHLSLFNSKTIINVANLVYQKAHFNLIKAFSLVAKQIRDVNLIIIGTGPLYNELQNLINSLNLNKRIFILQNISNPFPYIKKAQLAVLSSTNEGFPNVILEAMSLGKPVISTDCSSGPREILAPDTVFFKKTEDIEYAKHGILVPVFQSNLPFKQSTAINKEEKILADAIINVLQNEDLCTKYSLASLERIKDFQPSNIIQEWHNLLPK